MVLCLALSAADGASIPGISCYSALYAVVLQRAETDDDTSVEGMPELSYSPADGVYIVGESVVVFKGGLRYNLCGQRLWK